MEYNVLRGHISKTTKPIVLFVCRGASCGPGALSSSSLVCPLWKPTLVFREQQQAEGRKRCERTFLILDGAGSRQTAAPCCRGSAGSFGTNCVGEEDCFGYNEGSVC